MDVSSKGLHEDHDIFDEMKRGMFNAFWNIKERMSIGSKYFHVTTVIQTLQLFCLPIMFQGQLHLSESMQLQLKSVLQIFAYGYIDFENEVASVSILATTLALIGLTAIGIACIGYQSFLSERPALKRTMVSGLEKTVRLSQTVLLIPFIGTLTKFIRCPATINVCTGSTRIPIMICSSIGLALLCVLTLSNALLVMRTEVLNSKCKLVEDEFTAPHGRIEFLNTGIRATLAIVLGFLPGGKLDGMMLAFWLGLLITSGVSLSGAYTYYLPFTSQKWNIFAAGCYGTYLWFAISVSVHEIVGSSTDLSSRVLFTATLPFVIICSHSLVYFRRSSLVAPALDLIRLSQYSTELHLRLMFLTTRSEDGVRFSGDFESNCKIALQNFPTSAYLRLCIADICRTSKRLVFGLNLIRETRELGRLSLDLEFGLFCANMKNVTSSESEDTESYMAYGQLMQDSKNTLISTLKASRNFWKQLRLGEFSVDSLIETGGEIHKKSELCKTYLSKLLKISSSHKDTIKLYSLYLEYIMNDRSASKKILERVSHSSVQSSFYAVATVSGNTATLGQVLDVTDDMSLLFGYPREEMIGRNVSFLCPPPFDRVHDMLLKQFLSLDMEFETKTRQIFGMHHDGHIFTLDFVLTPSTNSNSDLVLVGKFNSKDDPTKHLLMVDAQTHLITAASKAAPDVFNMDVHDIFAMKVHINDIVPDFFTDKSEITSNYIKNGAGAKTATIGNKLVSVQARCMNYDSKPDYSVSFKLGIIMVTLEVQQVLQRDEYNSSLASDSDDSEDEVEVKPGNLSIPQVFADSESKGFSFGRKRFTDAKGRSSARSSATSSNDGVLRTSPSGRSNPGKVRSYQSSKDTCATDAASIKARQVHQRIMDKVQNSTNSAVNFSKYVLFFTFLVVAVGIARHAMMESVHQIYLTRAHDMGVSFQRTQHLAEIAKYMEFNRNLDLFIANNTIVRNIVPENFDVLSETLHHLKGFHFHLVDRYELSGPKQVGELLYNPDIRVTGDGETFKNTSLHIGVMDVLGHLKNYIEVDHGKCKQSCRFILNNIMFDDFIARSLESSVFYLGYMVEAGSSIIDYSIMAAITVSTIFVGAFFYIFLPLFRIGSRRKLAIGTAFACISIETIVSLEKRAENRISSLRRNQLIADEIDDDYSEAVALVTTATSLHEGRTSSCDLTQPPITPKLTRTRGTKAYSKLFRTILKVGVTFWVSIFYFSTMSLLELSDQRHLDVLGSSTQVAGLQGTYSTLLEFWIVVYPNHTQGFREDYATRYTALHTYFDLSTNYYNALRFGNSELNVEPFTSTSGILFEKYYEPQCLEDCRSIHESSNYSIDFDITNDLNHGLMFTVESFMRRVESIAEAMTKYDQNPTEAAYLAMLLSKSQFDSQDATTLLLDTIFEVLDLFVQLIDEQVSANTSRNFSYLMMYSLLMLLAYLYTLVAIRGMENEIKDAHVLLLMVPVELYSDVPELSRLIQKN